MDRKKLSFEKKIVKVTNVAGVPTFHEFEVDKKYEHIDGCIQRGWFFKNANGRVKYYFIYDPKCPVCIMLAGWHEAQKPDDMVRIDKN